METWDTWWAQVVALEVLDQDCLVHRPKSLARELGDLGKFLMSWSLGYSTMTQGSQGLERRVAGHPKPQKVGFSEKTMRESRVVNITGSVLHRYEIKGTASE